MENVRGVLEWNGTSWSTFEHELCTSLLNPTTIVYGGEIYLMGQNMRNIYYHSRYPTTIEKWSVENGSACYYDYNGIDYADEETEEWLSYIVPVFNNVIG